MKLQRCNSRSFSNSRNGEEEKSQSIPFDLVMEILMRLPSKSIARFRCVSKLWDSTLVSPEFIEYFNTISASRPKLLFTCLKDGKTFFFSSPKPQDSSPLAADLHMSFPINRPHEIFRPVRGLVCGLNQHTTKRGTVNMPLICNPSTGETVPLPILKTRRKRGVTSYLGYDPIDKQFKVLCMTHSRNRPFWSHEVEVLTLGTGTNPSWRVIGCDIPHERVLVDRTSGHSAYDGICINGVLYYLAYLLGEHTTGVVCFEFRSEKFNCIRLAEGMGSAYSTQSTLVNYKGKLALLLPNIVPGVQLWVLEDAETHQWSSFIYLWSPRKKIVAKTNSGKKIRKNIKLRNVGTLHTKKRYVVTTDTGKIVWSPEDISDSFYLLYYNPERNTATSIRIKGMEAFKEHKAYTFLDHVEDLRQVSKIVGS